MEHERFRAVFRRRPDPGRMAAVPPRTGFYSMVRATKPVAILLDGGGNDVHRKAAAASSPWFPRTPLYRLADPPGATPSLNAEAMRLFIDKQLRGQLDTVLQNLVEATKGAIPIFVHGYDHPIPDGRGFPPLGKPWLDPVNQPPYMSETSDLGRTIMRLLIDELNVMISDAVKPFASQEVRHMKLTGTLAQQANFDHDHTVWWLNELHPTKRGYDTLAVVVDEAISPHVPTPARPKNP